MMKRTISNINILTIRLLSQVDKDNKAKCISGSEENRYGTKDIKTTGGQKTQNPLVIYLSLHCVPPVHVCTCPQHN